MSTIVRDVGQAFVTGQGTASGTAAVLTASAAKAARGVLVIPAAANTGIIEFGIAGVTYGAGCLVPASGVTIPIEDPTRIYLIASAASQDYYYAIF